MPGAFESPAAAAAPAADQDGPGFQVNSESVYLDFDFARRAVRGKAELQVQPLHAQIGTIRLNCRQAAIKRVTVDGKLAAYEYNNPHSHIYLSEKSTVHHHAVLRRKVEEELYGETDDDLVIAIPRKVAIREMDPFSALAQEAILPKSAAGRDGAVGSLMESLALKSAEDGGTLYHALKVVIDYEIDNFRDGLHFAGLDEADSRFPHIYTRNSPFPGTASCLFPCVDDGYSRCVWDITIRCPRTLGDAFRRNPAAHTNGVNGTHQNGLPNGVKHDQDIAMTDAEDEDYGLSEEEKALEVSVICSGDLTDDIVDPADPSRKTVTFSCANAVAPQHIAIAVGPFEHVDLSDLRESDDDEMMGQAAIRVHGFCLPGRSDEVRNTCMALAKATDHFSKTYISYPFTSYKIVFVDDLPQDVAHAASLSLCNNSILFPEDVIEPLLPVTRKLVHAVASQWIGVNVIAKSPQDWWIIYATSHFMADDFMEQLCGRNEHRYRMKMLANKIVEVDVNRPSLHDLGQYLSVDPSEVEFMELKAPLVMFILNQKIKRMAKMGVSKIIYKVLLQAKTGKLQNGAIDTAEFINIVDRYLESKPIPDFWRQWIYGSGCPHFYVTQRFNKKKSQIEFQIKQTQSETSLNEEEKTEIDPASFLKQVREGESGLVTKKPRRVFTGAMTITVHEADGTPYDHIVPIHDTLTKFEAPYNTKYLRLKRNRRQKEREAAKAGVDITGDGDVQDDVLLYCLGDVLDTEQDVQDWKFADWSKEEEERMEQENFEWVRIDADFEWICRITFAQPHYMYVSQLQQDPDVVAQVDAIQYLAAQRPHPLISTVLTRTLMDRRYFHGIRTMATEAIAKSAEDRLDYIGLFHLEKVFQENFCLPDSPMVRSNDFSDRNQYLVQCAIPRAIATVRDPSGRGLMKAKRWVLDKLKFNDNGNNEFSDCYYVATLLSCLTETLISTKNDGPIGFEFDDEDEADEEEFKKEALDEIDRHRRLDEWIPSYHNIITVTALDCHRRLIENGVVPRKMSDFLQYTQPGAADAVRLKAFDCLIELNMFKFAPIMRLVVFNLAYDPSPYFRQQLYHLVGKAFGRVAIGRKEEAAVAQNHGGLIIEDTGTDERSAMIERTQTLVGARKALKAELENNEVLKESMRNALISPTVGLNEWGQLLQICSLLYEQKNTLMATVKYPHHWNVERQGKGLLRFYRSKNYRTEPLETIRERRIAATQAQKRRRTSISDQPLSKRPHRPLQQHHRPSPSPSLLSQPQPPRPGLSRPPSASMVPGRPESSLVAPNQGTPAGGGERPKLKIKFKNMKRDSEG
ncbi:hypothetical protein K490DRAFT_46280 [Saccharata proteae CBS 121410]|uniref:Transcription initiation factor TFIID subunit 2 n=1 Tax=Saccharata proteae CBS 121410 TaxID=1314787 RepID=A0A9P4LTJ6_9PEZI|nr:hypothetical protein K490DRAFT_46280 [Saccharata proteae CBS 121410]